MPANYLQFCLDQHQAGATVFTSHLMWLVNAERQKLANKVQADGFWFVDIPRTSSSSLQLELERHFGWPHGKNFVPGKELPDGQESALLPPHVPAFIAREIIEPNIWDLLETFTIVRNPETWAVSLWKYTHHYGDLGFDQVSFTDFLHKFEQNVAPPVAARSFFPSNFIQSDYVLDPRNEQPVVKHLLKFEDRAAIKSFAQDILGAKLDLSEKLVSTNTASYTVDDDERRLIRKLFERDYDLFQY